MTGKTYLLCLDPGKASGVALLDTTSLQEDGGAPVTIVTSAELQPEDLDGWLMEQFARAIEEGAALEAVCEAFLITPQTGKNSFAPWSLMKIGVLDFLCRMYGVPFKLQTPADAKSFVSNQRLRDLELWHRGGAGHANDALRHGVLYLIRERGWSPEKLLVASES